MADEFLKFLPETLFSRNFIIRDQSDNQVGRVEYSSIIRPSATIRYLDDRRYLSRQLWTIFKARFELLDEWKLRDEKQRTESRLATATRFDIENVSIRVEGKELYLVADSILPHSVRFLIVADNVSGGVSDIGWVARNDKLPESFEVHCDPIVAAPTQLFIFTLALAQIRHFEAISNSG